jgi:photosystem II stability/assembly factor-like uncharacterized protein
VGKTAKCARGARRTVNGGAIRRTTNAGASWRFVTSTGTVRPNAVAFGSATVGVTVGDAKALSTVTEFRDVTFLDVNTAIAAGQGATRGVILSSADGGRRWTSVDSGITGAPVNFAVAFASPTVGAVTGDRGSVLRITTGGL